ncbi:MAG: hypothetical protein IID32_06245 [Planctomycetes bacterium]|nr:hypothetical protein [Planctomycetota bacterium]
MGAEGIHDRPGAYITRICWGVVVDEVEGFFDPGFCLIGGDLGADDFAEDAVDGEGVFPAGDEGIGG